MDEGLSLIPLNTQCFIIIGGGGGVGRWASRRVQRGGGAKLWPFAVSLFLLTKGQQEILQINS